MKYAFSEEGRLINGVIIYFEAGDRDIAIETFKFISNSGKTPTSIVWDGYSPEVKEVLSRLRQEPGVLNSGTLGVRLTVNETDRLLKDYLAFLLKRYPALSAFVKNIDSNVFGTPQ